MQIPADLHPDDAAARNNLRQTLVNYREQQGITQRTLAARLNVSPSAVNKMEQHSMWRLLNLQRWVTALDLELLLIPIGLPIPPDDVQALAAIRPTSPHLRHEFARAAILADLVAARYALGLTQDDIGQRLGRKGRAVAEVERQHWDVMVVTLQRYCRALGGHLQFDLEPVNDTNTAPTLIYVGQS